MRDFTKLSPKFWISKSQKKIRDAGPEAMIVALYLLSSPHSNMLGFYYLPLPLIAYETGLGLEGASKGLRRGIEAGFCYYDEDTEYVWVCDMAEMQIGQLKPTDKNCKGVYAIFSKLPDTRYKTMFYDRYRETFHLDSCLKNEQKTPNPFEGPSKGLRSIIEIEKEREKEKKQPPPNPPRGTGGRNFDFESVELPDWLSSELWRDWGEYCVELRRPMRTHRGALACIAQLSEFRAVGYSPESVIRHTMSNDWKALSVKNIQRGERQQGDFIDLEGAFFRIIVQGKKPLNAAEKLARVKYSQAGLRTAGETACRAAWRGYLTQAYRESGEKPI